MTTNHRAADFLVAQSAQPLPARLALSALGRDPASVWCGCVLDGQLCGSHDVLINDVRTHGEDRVSAFVDPIPSEPFHPDCPYDGPDDVRTINLT